ncbi:glycosyltransferase family 2 protein [Geminocystis sp.]|uniref:glycosyltransferase family 2 protein n=1 Tax=Geminocystis sp. TaxID=2664100 RepID=UPI003593EBF5
MLVNLDKFKSNLRFYYGKFFPRFQAINGAKSSRVFHASLVHQGKVVPNSGIHHYFYRDIIDNNKNYPLISCILIRKSSFPIVEASINCFINQNYPNKELIIIDNLADKQLPIYIKKINHSQIIYLNLINNNYTFDDLQNIAWEKVSGDYICQWDDCHLADAMRLKRQMIGIEKLDTLACLLERCFFWLISEKSFAISPRRIWHNSLLCAKSLLADDPIKYITNDSALVVNLLQKYPIALLDQPQLYVDVISRDKKLEYSQYWNNNSENFNPIYYEEMLRELQKRFIISENDLKCLEKQENVNIFGQKKLNLDAQESRGIIINLKENETEIKGENWLKEKWYSVGIVISCYNRPQYLELTLDSVKKSKINNSIIYLVDDHSDNEITINLINSFMMENIPVFKIFKSQNKGIGDSLKRGWDFLVNHCDFLCNLDSDVLVKPQWLDSLQNLYIKYSNLHGDRQIIITGFNTSNHQTLWEKDDYVVKQTIGGVNMFLHTSLYYKYFRNALENHSIAYSWDHTMIDQFYNWELQTTDKVRCLKETAPTIPKTSVLLSTKPSVIQHIGIEGLHGNIYSCDQAEDFEQD